MSSLRDAKELIDRIQSEHTIEGHEKLASIINNTLHLLSTELYDTATHFILELLQNADDNAYEDVIPTFELRYRPGSLRVDCNETGFTERNVESICTVRCSTKSNRDPADGCTGEKGIGFKSVFRVADVVWISSNEYKFKLDKRVKFGMIAPSWAEIPGGPRSGHTSFYLELSRDFRQDVLINDLRAFNPELLLFLRRVRRIVLKIETVEGKEEWTQDIQRTDKFENGYMVTELTVGRKSTRYVVQKHRVENLPEERRRQGCKHSQLALAFPVTQSFTANISNSQNVYATLPVSNHGLKFLLHGDFLLSASRLQLDTSLAWNQALRDSVAESFIQTVQCFNKGDLKYLWPHYVPGPKTSSFFQPARSIIISYLKKNKVLQPYKGSLSQPSTLRYADPSKFADSELKPFTLGPHTESRYLSLQYKMEVIGSLFSIGLAALSSLEFLQDLETMISQDPQRFQSRSLRWHSQLAKALLPLSEDAANREILQRLDIVPLRDGRWVSADSGLGILPRRLSEPGFLDGIAIPETVDETAAEDRSRRALFTSLDMMTIDARELCHHIIRLHSAESFKPEAWDRAQLISHVKFLYEAEWRPRDIVTIWFATSNRGRCPGSKLYMPGRFEPDSPEQRLFDHLSRDFPTIDGAYLTVSDKKRSWIDYLTKFLQISTIPRLVQPISRNPEDGVCLSKEMVTLFKRCHTADVLHVLNRHWHFYAPWLDPNDEASRKKGSDLSRDSLLRHMGDVVVKTPIGQVHLKETVLPNLDPHIKDDILPILEMDTKGNKTLQQRLNLFGITVENNIHYYTLCLSRMRDEPSPNRERISYVYEMIQNKCDDNEWLVRDIFKTQSVIYVKGTRQKGGNLIGWANLDECVQSKVDLGAEYPRSKNLFQSLLATASHPIDLMVKKAFSINSSSKIPDILALFKNVSKVLATLNSIKAGSAVAKLLKKKIMPVVRNGKAKCPHDLLAPEDESWFIADQSNLSTAFSGKVPLLAFSAEEIAEIDCLIDGLGMSSRRLSVCVQTKSIPRGPLKLCSQYEGFLSDRIDFIRALVPDGHPKGDAISYEIGYISVSTAAAIVQAYTLQHRNTEVHGNIDTGKVAFIFNGDRLQLFLSEPDRFSLQTAFDVGDAIAKYCGIEHKHHLRLLYTTLSESSLRTIQAMFANEGFTVSVEVDSDDDTRPRYLAQSEELLEIQSPFDSSDDDCSGDDLNGVTITFKNRNRRDRNEHAKSIPDSDRRLPILQSLEDCFKVPGVLYERATLDPNSNLQYIGEFLASQFFKASLGNVYDPTEHWTSELRTRAGLSCLTDFESQSPFTMTGPFVTKRIVEFLLEQGPCDINTWPVVPTTFHFEIAASAGDMNSEFFWSWSQLERLRRFRSSGNVCGNLTDAIILIRISNVYQCPRFQILTNPWDIFASDHWELYGDYLLKTAIKGYSSSLENSKVDSTANTETATETIFEEGHHQSASTILSIQQWPNSKYVYGSLNHGDIRLLTLFPGDGNTPLCGMLSILPFTFAGSYRTVSYVWGSEDQPTHTLMTPGGVLTIRHSLNAALMQLRQKSDPIVLWIDAICINQDSLKEKPRQIRLLPKIFQGASCTIAFLGSDEQSDKAIRTLLQIKAKATIRGSNMKSWPKGLPHPPEHWGQRGMPGPESRIWDDVRNFFRRPWFRRAWIVQEAIAAPSIKLVCGKCIFDWNSLFGAMELVHPELQLSEIDTESWRPFLMLAKHREGEARHKRYPLTRLLESYRHVACTWQRDRFFALLGIASDGDQPEFEPDYTSPFEQIVLRFASAFVAQGRGIQLLNLAGLSSEPERFPSWIPDWTTESPGNLANSSGRGITFDASGSSKQDISTVPGTDMLATKGYLVDKIGQISKVANDPTTRAKYFKEVDSMLKDCTSYSSVRRKTLRWEVPIAGAKHPEVASSMDIELSDSYKALRKLLRKAEYKGSTRKEALKRMTKAADAGFPITDDTNTLSAKSMNYVNLLDNKVKGWKFVKTENGRCGIVSRKAEVGDDVCIINGGDVPFLIRKSQRNSSSYQLIGQCYIVDIMDGQALEADGAISQMLSLH